MYGLPKPTLYLNKYNYYIFLKYLKGTEILCSAELNSVHFVLAVRITAPY